MTSARWIAAATAAVAGVIVAIVIVILGGVFAVDDTPSTDLNKVNGNSGFLDNKVDYGSRDGGGDRA